MELGEIQHDHHSPTGFPAASLILYAFSWVAFWLQANSVDFFWTWLWRVLSVVSLILIIYINWNKAVDIFKSKKKK